METQKTTDDIIKGRLDAAEDCLKEAMELLLAAYAENKTIKMLLTMKKYFKN